MWEFFIKHNRFAYLFLVALVVLGAFSILSIPRESSPEVVIPIGVVTTILPGAPAANIESLITNKLENGLTSLENLKKITSTSREGASTLIVEFVAEADVDASIQDLKDEIDNLKQELPDDAEDPFVTEVNFVDQPILTLSLSANFSDNQFTALTKDLERELEEISGVARIQTQGVRDREVTVIVNQTALLQFDISLQDITNAIRYANITLPIGQIENNGVSYNIAFEGDITDTSDIGNISITTRGGNPIFIRDVATIVDGLTPAQTLSRLSIEGDPSKNAIGVDVYKQSGGDITKLTTAVHDRIEELQTAGELLDGVEVVTVIDMGDQILTDLKRLSFSGLQTVALVIILLIITIGWREGLLAGLAIPFSFLFGFIGLYLSGNTINFLSLFSLILGIGILVDSAIVMVEGINRRMKDNPDIDKKQAAILSIREFATPLISGTLTTVSMFVGLFIVSGIIGQFIASIPFTLIFLLFASLFVALAIIPLLASNFLHRKNTSEMEEKQTVRARRLEEWYKNKLRSIIGNKQKEKRFLWSIRGALLIALLLPVFGFVEVVFFDQSDVDWVIVEIEMPEGTTKEVTDIGIRRIEEVLYRTDDIDSFSVTVGQGNQFTAGGTGEKLANIFINLSKDRVRTSSQLVTDLRDEFAPIRDFKVSVTQPSDGPPTGAAVLVKFLGDDLDELSRTAQKAAEIFRSVDYTTNVEASTNNNNTEFVLELDKAKAASFGLNPFTISQIARTAVFGTDATSITTLQDDINVVVKLNAGNSNNARSDTTNEITIDALNRISIPTQSGSVPLSSLVTLSLRESSSVINHEDSRRVVSVTSDVAEGGNVRAVQSEVVKRINEEMTIPQGITMSIGGGETDESNKAFLEMLVALVVGLLLMVTVLVLQFNSYRYMFYVLSILPYSLIGVLFGLAITQNTLSFPSIMGFIALTGIVVNNSILLIQTMNSMRKERPELPIREVVINAAGSRIRPILLTMITTVIGMIPLTYAGDLWAPLAYAVMFGLIFSVVITLILVPVKYDKNPGALGN